VTVRRRSLRSDRSSGVGRRSSPVTSSDRVPLALLKNRSATPMRETDVVGVTVAGDAGVTTGLAFVSSWVCDMVLLRASRCWSPLKVTVAPVLLVLPELKNEADDNVGIGIEDLSGEATVDTVVGVTAVVGVEVVAENMEPRIVAFDAVLVLLSLLVTVFLSVLFRRASRDSEGSVESGGGIARGGKDL